MLPSAVLEPSTVDGEEWPKRHALRCALLLLTLLVVVPAQAGVAAAQDAGRPVIRVGTEGLYPPFSFHDPRSGALTGYDIEVVEAIAERAGWRLEFVETQWDAVFPALDSGRIDVVANQVSKNAERAAKYGLSDTYTYSHGVIVRRTGDESIKTLDDLQDKVTAESATSNWADTARDAGARVETVEGFAQAAALLTQGRVDAIVNDNIAVLDYQASTGSGDVEVAARPVRRPASRSSPSGRTTASGSTRPTGRSARSRPTARCAASPRSTSRPTSRSPTAAAQTCRRDAITCPPGKSCATPRGRCSSAGCR
ncbi:transporter substrate-binding domain-containing protein [Saccharopolyspora karakumensis]|uniref:Transporter substrate-binding domain-containing protein n=1 Tax=Saccharopolyspora karakumensis TaxID=2530386 RepID=A0A4R5BYC5_9PSEU|nr:transporter substrate-binding domain-containing protein [Saccharopolyspora karakumensis]TDD90866.1 transporter substrate-binding domain-containing protein [Saccharopolyspora karakumensis]